MIDDAQSGVAQSDGTIRIDVPAIRSAVPYGLNHPLKKERVGFSVIEMKDSGYTAHRAEFLLGFGPGPGQASANDRNRMNGSDLVLRRQGAAGGSGVSDFVSTGPVLRIPEGPTVGGFF
jgi:hypothetical protein